MVGGVLGSGAVMLVGDRQHNLRLSHQLGDGLVFHGRQRDLQQVPGGGVVVLVMQAVGVDKMGIGAAELIGTLVHQANEISRRAGNILCNGIAGFVCRNDHHAVKHVFQRHLFACHQTGRAAVLIHAVIDRFVEG